MFTIESRPAGQNGGSEGQIISNRNWEVYKLLFSISDSLVQDMAVLNFGCGSSNLKPQMLQKGINCTLVDIDKIYDPFESILMNGLQLFLARSYNFLSRRKILPDNARHKLTAAKRKITNTAGRPIVQGDGRFLPFATGQFDIVFAALSTYQIPYSSSGGPDPSREHALSELLRVGRRVHIAPVYQIDFDIISDICENMGHKIISCDRLEDSRVNYYSRQDYALNCQRWNADYRIKRPEEPDGRITSGIFGSKHVISQEICRLVTCTEQALQES